MDNYESQNQAPPIESITSVQNPIDAPITEKTHSKKKSIVGISLLLIVIIVGVASFLFLSKRTAPISVEDEPLVIGFSIGTLQEERWQRDRDNLIKETDRLGITLNMLSSNNNAAVQMDQVRSLIQQGVDVLVIAPYDADSIAPVVDEAHQAGIKVISYDRLIRNANVDLYISFDNTEVGRLQAKGVVDGMEKGNIAYIGGSLTDNNALLLKEGTMEILKPLIDAGDITLVYEAFSADWKPENAYANLKKYLATNKNIDGVIAANDGTAFGSINALSEYNLAGKIPVSGQDAELSACQRIIEGTQTMTVYKPISALAKATVAQAVKLAKNQTPEVTTTISNGDYQNASYLITPVAVTKDTIMETVVKDGYHPFESIYSNVPESERPPKP